jgi:N-methylhydantoinase A
MQLDVERAVAVIATDVSSPLGLTDAEAASAILRLATENMVSAIEEITINQGIDPRGAVLVGGGGAAGLNSVAIARRLGCRAVVIPEVGAALSAAGALMSDLQADHRALHYAATDKFDFEGVNGVLESLAARCTEFIEGPGLGGTEHAIDLYAEGRYRHQIWEIDLPLQIDRFRSEADLSRVREDFDRLHEEVFAFRDPGSEVEFVGWRATARTRLRSAGIGRLQSERAFEAEVSSSRETYFAGHGSVATEVQLFEAMEPGATVEGPAIIESPFTTVVVDPGATAARTEGGTLVITP